MHFLCDSQKGTAFENQVLLPISTIPTNLGATLATFCTGWFRPRCPPESPCGKTRQSFQSTSVVVVATEFSSATGICRTSGPASHVSPPCAVQHVRACKRMHIRKQVDHAINKSSTYSNQWKIPIRLRPIDYTSDCHISGNSIRNSWAPHSNRSLHSPLDTG